MVENIGIELRSLNISLLRYIAHHRSEISKTPDGELTGVQVWVIEYLLKRQDEDVFQKDLEKEFMMRRPTATNFIKKLEQAELIRREPVAYDARLKKIILTEKAVKMQQEMELKMKQFEKLLRGDLTPDEIATFIATINKIKRNIGVGNA
ncbi:MarR family transcriptional regulator [Pseudolactococcus yaeyamensis]